MVPWKRKAPALPGGFKAGERVYFTGMSMKLSSNSADKRTHGQAGKVLGLADEWSSAAGKTARMVCVHFDGNSLKDNVLPETLSRDPPPPLPGDRE